MTMTTVSILTVNVIDGSTSRFMSESRFPTRQAAETARELVMSLHTAACGYGTIETNIWEVSSLNGVEIPSSLIDLIRKVGRERKVDCIKVVRQLTKTGLKEAKDVVDELLKTDPPNPFL